MAKGLPLKRAIIAGSRHTNPGIRKKGVSGKLERLEKTEERLEEVADEIMTEIEEIEGIKKSVLKEKPADYWRKAKLFELIGQDAVGAAFGAMFFVVTQEVWELATGLSVFGLFAIIAFSFFLDYFLIHASRRRNFVSIKIEKSVLMRSIEIYLVSFAISLIFVLILGVGQGMESMLKISALITLPAVVSAATADLLFF